MAYLGFSVTYMHCGHVQLCGISVSNPFVMEPPVLTWYFFLQNGCLDIVDMKQFLLYEAYKHHIISVL